MPDHIAETTPNHARSSTHLWQRAKRRARALRGRLRRDDRGATAIEFAVVGTLFFTIVFAILELALIFFTSSVLSHATAEAGRSIRVGQFQGCGKQDAFKALVCDRMKGMLNCSSNLRVDVITGSGFRSLNMPDAGNGGISDPNGNQQVNNGRFDSTQAGDPVAVRATFYYPLMLPPKLTRLETRGGAGGGVVAPGRHIIRATTAFRNEPFPDSSTCDVKFKK